MQNGAWICEGMKNKESSLQSLGKLRPAKILRTKKGKALLMEDTWKKKNMGSKAFLFKQNIKKIFCLWLGLFDLFASWVSVTTLVACFAWLQDLVVLYFAYFLGL